MQQTVKDYLPTETFLPSVRVPQGDSASPKGMIFYVLESNAAPVAVMDIGFGVGSLGQMIKNNPATRHWEVDGMDSFAENCQNLDLIDRKIYRNIWHGLAQALDRNLLERYTFICLFDVIEHLPADAAKSLLRTLLENMRQDAYLIVSTPLWFYPQASQQEGDFEEHLIGVPATSMMALIPVMYAITDPLVGGFVLTKKSLDYVDFFQPSTDRNFTMEKGAEIARVIGLQNKPGTIFRV